MPIKLTPPPQVEKFSWIWQRWLYDLYKRSATGPFMVSGYAKADLPDATKWADSTFSSVVYVTDEVGGSTLAFSDGTDWRRVSDRAIIS